ncbi:MAG: iron chaperone [Bacteroidota bacterium]
MQSTPVPASVDAYIDSFDEPVHSLLKAIRKAIRETAPEAEECISYQMPAYKLHGMLVYFAGYAKHIGFYPGAAGIENFRDEIKGFKNAKGSVQFALDKPLPLELVKRITAFRVRENLEKAALKKKKQ